MYDKLKTNVSLT